MLLLLLYVVYEAWWSDPLFNSSHDYPSEMRSAVGSRLPTFTSAEQSSLASAIPDFFAYNHYSSNYVFEQKNSTDPFVKDQQAGTTYTSVKGELIGLPAASSWLHVVPWVTQQAHDKNGNMVDHRDVTTLQ